MRPTDLAVVKATSLLTLVALATAVAIPSAQAQMGWHDPNDIPRVNVALGYNLVRSNAPPAACNCFGANGAFASVDIALRPWLAAAAEVSGSHANQIGPLGQDLTLLTYTAGPRVVFRTKHFRPFAQALFGAGHGSDSYFPSGTGYSTSATSFAYNLGGGIDFHLSHTFDIRPVELQYLHTAFSNGTDNSQNHIVYGAGIVIKFHSHLWTPDPGHARAKADKAERKADAVAMATPVVAPAPPPPPVPPPAPAPAPQAVQVAPVVPTAAAFHAGVPDIYFDYDSIVLRPAAQQTIASAAQWLQDNPNQRVEIGGYADERGSQDYNLVLAGKRAEITRAALVAAGVNPARLVTHSYGKLVQTCSATEESCYRQNRRAAFNPMP